MNKREIQLLALSQILSAINRHDYDDRFWLALQDAISPHGLTQPSDRERAWYTTAITREVDRIADRIRKLEQPSKSDRRSVSKRAGNADF